MVSVKFALPLLFALLPSTFGLAINVRPTLNLGKQTNADRLAHGLGPLPPSRRSTAGAAKRSSKPDTIAKPTMRYVIRLRNPSDNSDIGAVSMPADDGNNNGDLLDYDPDTSRAMRFAFGPTAGQGQPFDISPMDPTGSFGGGKSLLLGAIPGNPSSGSDSDLASGSPNFANIGMGVLGNDNLLHISASAQTPSAGNDGALGDALDPLDSDFQGTPAQDVSYPAQSGIWGFDPNTQRLVARYVNSDGSIVPTSFVTGGPCHHTLCLVADVAAFQNAYGSDALEVHVLAIADL
ncbi:MAG: hypothetical protein TREMPRED_001546 [Tremellales sp. Tagirdzhanova-0007]|nr:MAG: hypothetical protein TREMPRED_001546 [Tremellales sp. Tagirdzhanova-0007]